MEQTRSLFCTCDSGVACYQSQHRPVPLLTNEFDVLSILHGQMSLAAVNQICVIKGLLRKGKYKRDDLLNSLHVG